MKQDENEILQQCNEERTISLYFRLALFSANFN